MTDDRPSDETIADEILGAKLAEDVGFKFLLEDAPDNEIPEEACPRSRRCG